MVLNTFCGSKLRPRKRYLYHDDGAALALWGMSATFCSRNISLPYGAGDVLLKVQHPKIVLFHELVPFRLFFHQTPPEIGMGVSNFWIRLKDVDLHADTKECLKM